MSDVDALIVNFFTDDLTQQSARRLKSCANVFVWDNSATLDRDELPAGVQFFTTGENLMYAAASNMLLRQSDAPYILLANPDALVDEHHVALLREALDNDTSAWGTAPRLVGLDGKDQRYRRRLPTLSSLFVDRVPFAELVFPWVMRRHYYLDVHPTDAVVEQPAAACLLLRRDMLDGLLFDERYRLFGNDTDLARRLNRLGHCRYASSVVVPHVGGASIAVARTKHQAWIRAEYDRSLRMYARSNIPHSAILEPIFALRLLSHRVGARVVRSSAAPPLLRASTESRASTAI